jgi:hypothetical protein
VSPRADRVLDALARALARERALLGAGDFAGLAAAAEEREAQTAALERLELHDLANAEAALGRLRAAAARNVALLRAALEGAAAGRRRAAEISEARARLSSYDRSGAPVDRTVARRDGRCA